MGFDHEQVVEGGTIRVILEKDFACLDRPAGTTKRKTSWRSLNPSEACR